PTAQPLPLSHDKETQRSFGTAYGRCRALLQFGSPTNGGRSDAKTHPHFGRSNAHARSHGLAGQRAKPAARSRLHPCAQERNPRSSNWRHVTELRVPVVVARVGSVRALP